MVASLSSACIWFVYVTFVCADVTNGWMIVAAECKYGIDVYWFGLLMVFMDGVWVLGCRVYVPWWLPRFRRLVFDLCMRRLYVLRWWMIPTAQMSISYNVAAIQSNKQFLSSQLHLLLGYTTRASHPIWHFSCQVCNGAPFFVAIWWAAIRCWRA